MQQALMNSRSSNPAPAGQPPVPGTPGAPGAGAPPELAALASDIQDIKASLSKLVEAISGQYTGKAEGPEPVEGEDDKPEGSAKTFK